MVPFSVRGGYDYISCCACIAYLSVKNGVVLVIGYTIYSGFHCLVRYAVYLDPVRRIHDYIAIFIIPLDLFVESVVAYLIGCAANLKGRRIIKRSYFCPLGCSNLDVVYRTLVVNLIVPDTATPVVGSITDLNNRIGAGHTYIDVRSIVTPVVSVFLVPVI
jgi:hypothetical protein